MKADPLEGFIDSGSCPPFTMSQQGGIVGIVSSKGMVWQWWWLLTEKGDLQVLLRVTHFNMCFDHPHKYLFNYAGTLGCSGAMVRVALGLVNDSLIRTNMCLSCQPWEVAAGALHVSSLLTGEVQAIPHLGPLNWWDGLDLSLSRLEDVGHMLLDMLPPLPASGGRDMLPPLPTSGERER